MTQTIDAYVILPDGRLERDTMGIIPDDVELEPIVFQEVSNRPHIQAIYEGHRLNGQSHVTAILSTYRETFGGTTITGFPMQRFRYQEMRIAGESHNMAEMLATRTFPGVKSDAIFNEGKFSGASTGECDARGAWLRRQAEEAGVSTTGKWYCSGLASFPGDPTAWVDSRGDVLRVAREKNMTVHGYVEHQGHEVDPGEDIVVADDLIENEVADIMDSYPGADATEVRDRVYELRTGRVDPNPLRVEDSGELP